MTGFEVVRDALLKSEALLAHAGVCTSDSAANKIIDTNLNLSDDQKTALVGATIKVFSNNVAFSGTIAGISGSEITLVSNFENAAGDSHSPNVGDDYVVQISSRGLSQSETTTAVNNSYLVNNGAEPTASVTRPNDTTAYAIGDTVSTAAGVNLEFANVLATAGANFIILGADLLIGVNAVPAGMSSFRLHLYDAAPTAIADNVAWTLASADAAKYLGYIEITTPTDKGDVILGTIDNLVFKRKLAAASTTLYGMLETRGAYTPTAEAVKTVKLHVVGI